MSNRHNAARNMWRDRPLSASRGSGRPGRRVDQEAGVTVAGAAGLFARRLQMPHGGTHVPDELLNMSPVQGRRARTGGLALEVPAVLKAGNTQMELC